MPSPNPFTPMFGRIPPFMAGREHLLQDIQSAFEQPGSNPNLCTILVGARGTGKTALLTYLSRDASSRGWVVANVSAAPGMLNDILERANESAEPFIRKEDGRRLTSVSIGGIIGAEWEHEDAQPKNWRTKMNYLLDALSETDRGLLITVDEVVANVDEMIQLATVFQHFVREERKVALLMAGLAGNVSSLVSNESVSFLRRAKTRRLGRIADVEISHALRKTVELGNRKIDDDALQLAVDAIKGFPYMLQVVGFRLWEENPDKPSIGISDAKEAIPLAKNDLEEGVLSATLRELSDGDIEFLCAMLDDERESKIADIAKRTGKPANQARVYKKRLLEQGIIAEGLGGHVKFELPFFREFLKEQLK